MYGEHLRKSQLLSAVTQKQCLCLMFNKGLLLTGTTAAITTLQGDLKRLGRLAGSTKAHSSHASCPELGFTAPAVFQQYRTPFQPDRLCLIQHNPLRLARSFPFFIFPYGKFGHNPAVTQEASTSDKKNFPAAFRSLPGHQTAPTSPWKSS